MKLLVILLVLTLTALTACVPPAGVVRTEAETAVKAALPTVSETKGKLSVMGEGVVTYTPDTVHLDLGVEVQKETAAEAHRQASDAISRLTKALIDKVPEKDIQTIYISLYPVYDYEKKVPQLIGYRFVHKVRIKVRQIEQAGPILDTALEALGEWARVDNISFTIDDPKPLYTQARERAVKDAQAKAEKFASLLGIALGKPISISESPLSLPYLAPPPKPIGMEIREATPVFPGEREIRLTVYIEYEIG